MRMGWLPSRCIASFAAGKRHCSNSAQHVLTKASLTGQQVQHLRLEKPALLLLSEAERLLRERQIDLLLLDLLLPDGSGFDVLRTARDLDEDIVVIAMTAFAEVKTAVRAMKEGAYDFIVKPFELDDLRLTVQRVIQTQQLRR